MQIMTTIEMKNRTFSLNINYASVLQAITFNQPVSSLWHKRLGHVNFQSLKVLYNQRMVHGLPYIEEEIQVIEKNQTWVLVDRPKDKDVVDL